MTLHFLRLFCVDLQPNSQFAAAYSKGINKLNYWEPVLEDSIDIIAKLPAVAALIYRNTYKGGNSIEADSKLDWAANLSHMMGQFSWLKCRVMVQEACVCVRVCVRVHACVCNSGLFAPCIPDEVTHG